MQTFAVTMLGSIFESNNKIRNIPSLFTFTDCLIFNIFFAFSEDKWYKKKFDIAFDEMSGNGKLDKVIKEPPDESSNPFLALTHGKVIRFSYVKKNYPFPAGIYLLKVNNRNTRTRCEICSKLTIKTPERRLASF